MSGFALHPQLASDTFDVVSLEVCRVLLANDARFPWLILVPQIENLRNWHEVPDDRQAQVLAEVNLAAAALEAIAQAHKMNVAALGNQVAQLHIHVIARQEHDAAWPKPVWGEGRAIPYEERARHELLERLTAHLTRS